MVSVSVDSNVEARPAPEMRGDGVTIRYSRQDFKESLGAVDFRIILHGATDQIITSCTPCGCLEELPRRP